MQSSHSDQQAATPDGEEQRSLQLDSAGAVIGARRAHTRWLPIAALLLAAGLAASLGAALAWRDSVRARERQSFQTLASYVSGRLELLVRRDSDLVRADAAVFAMQPEISPGVFQRWAKLLEDETSANGEYGVLLVRSLHPAQLHAFLARRNSDPAFAKLVGGQIEPVEAGASRYCLISAGSAPLTAAPLLVRILQGNWCNPQSTLGSYRQNGVSRAQLTRYMAEADTAAIYRIPGSPVPAMAFEAPVFPPSGAPTSASARWHEVTGWVAGSFAIESLMRQALGGRSGLLLRLYHQAGGVPMELIGQSGKAAGSLTSRQSLALDGSWRIVVVGAAPNGSIGANVQGLVVGLAGVIATLLVVALVGVLARSRRHALALVAKKTAELEHLALHDALTDLPNRVLALDRAEQMLARAKREGNPMAALYLDIDGFKEVNDTLGHAAGDRLLREIAERLMRTVREGETAARIGGDEFVVLVEPSAINGGPEHLAERLIDALRGPYRLDEQAPAVAITASVGVAKGAPRDVDELLREADLALYAAKQSGRNRFAVYRAPEHIHSHN